MVSEMCPICVCGCDSSKNAERPVTTNQDNLGLAPTDLMNMIERVEKVVLEDRRMSAEHFASKVGISMGSVHKINKNKFNHNFQWSNQTPKEAFAEAMTLWRRRCEKCVRLQGDYAEK